MKRHSEASILTAFTCWWRSWFNCFSSALRSSRRRSLRIETMVSIPFGTSVKMRENRASYRGVESFRMAAALFWERAAVVLVAVLAMRAEREEVSAP